MPGPVIDLTVTHLSPSSVEISWSPPISNPNCVKHYHVTWQNNVTTTENTEIVIENLEPCHIHTVTVCTINPNDEMGDCEDISFKMEPDGE